MHPSQFFAGIIALLLAAAFARADGGYDPDANRQKTTTYETIWHDKDRDRDVPVKIYYPADTKEKSPVIIFSHGLGGSREGYGYLGEHWASHGFISVHITHHGSDTEAAMANGIDQFKQTAEAIATDPMNALNRVKDVSFIIDQLTGTNVDEKSPLFNKLDLSRIGMAGHSFGANTTMLISGEMSHSGHTFADERIKCAIAMSPPVAVPKVMYDRAYTGVKIPLFVMTGTKDDSPIGESKAVDRRVPFDHVKDIPAYLITFDGGDHMLFSGNKMRVKQPTDDRYHQLILQGSTAFWDAYLRSDDAAKKWLSRGGYEKAVGDGGKFEEKIVQ
jgi:predicted dienelactone hydrolase